MRAYKWWVTPSISSNTVMKLKSNSSLQNQLVKWGVSSFYKLLLRFYVLYIRWLVKWRMSHFYKLLPKILSIRCELEFFSSDVRLLNTPLMPMTDIWSVDINGGWPDSGNLIACGPKDFGESFDTMLKFKV